MKVLHQLPDFSENRRVFLTQGTFDGVHLGHKKILSKLISEAKVNDGVSVLLTFYPHPRLVLYPEDNSLKLLSSLEEKEEILRGLGLDYLIVLPFTKELSRMSAFDFVRDVLVKGLKVYKFIIGYDHRFGRNREGSLTELREYATTFDFELEEISAKDVDSAIVSSTKIRKAVLEGKVEKAASFLGRNYRLRGKVVKGHARGRKMGYPTANIELGNTYKLIPMNGVYAVFVHYSGHKIGGMMNIGINPTFDAAAWSVEVHIFDFNTDIYGEIIDVECVRRLRDEVKFNNADELIKQLQNDEQTSRKTLDEHR